MHGSGSQFSDLEQQVLERTGCSRLCLLLAALGLSLTTAASLFTYRALHEPLEAVGASMVNHLASSSCTAITGTLASLSATRSDMLSGDAVAERSATDATSVLGVVTPGSWRLENLQSTATTKQQALRVLQQLPPAALTSPVQTPQPGGTGRPAVPESQRCTPLGYGLHPQAVRVFRISDPSAGASHGHEEPGSPWLAFLLGPFRSEGQQKTAFALVNLRAATLEISGHPHDINAFVPAGDSHLQLSLQLQPRSVLGSRVPLPSSLPGLSHDDAKLRTLKVVPFANQVVVGAFGIDHTVLDRLSRRMAAFIALIGLLATSAVVLISRRSEVKLRALNRNLLQESRTDGLTRVANRRAWDEVLALEEGRRRRYGHRYGLVVVDLDGFKQINDRLGHPQGDAVLQQTARVLREVLRSTDLVARVGGDEFVALVCNPDAEGLDELVRRLQDNLQALGIAASIGTALSDARTTLDQSWAQADTAMYAVKTAARS